MSTVVKWAGGKTRLLPELERRLPVDYRDRRHIELFAGGAALFFHMRPRRALLADRNMWLIELYRLLQRRPRTIKQAVQGHARHHSRDHYYRVRDRFNAQRGTLEQRVAMFLYLNRAGFNGLYRENASGQLNVPYGDATSASIYQPQAICACAEALGSNTTLIYRDFAQAARIAVRGWIGDFFYLDPPYAPTCRASFKTYVAGGFRHEDHVRLLHLVRELDAAGAKVMLSNADTFFVRDLFRNFRIDTVQGSRSISRDGNGRGRVRELVIRNYDD